MARGSFVILAYDMSPAAAHSKPPEVPQTPVDHYPEALAMFRACLLKTPHAFDCKLRVPSSLKGQEGEVQVELRWESAGDTCGVALWSNRQHTVSVSILLNGLESKEDLVRVQGVLAQRGFALPGRILGDINRNEQRPLGISLFYSRGAMQFGMLLGIMPLFARAYFDLFGTTQGESDP